MAHLIHRLEADVIDQIAAGEVVERPAFLLKELVENSLDAGADEIEIEFDQGGRQVCVRDNGAGIYKDDLPLALARHATSKIQHSNDLWALNSFGFRGEALASIAAVSRIKLLSKPKDQESAFELDCEFGRISDIHAKGGGPGTTVWVSELFANLPARLKFLKSEAAENGQVKTVIKALAMVNPQATFRVRHKGKLLYYFKSTQDSLARVKEVLEIPTLYHAKGEVGTYRAEIFFASPKDTVKSRRQVWLFAQNRLIEDRAMQAAVMDAYRSLLMHGEYPVCVVFLSCHPEDIDVNIHPTKSQVKFRDNSNAYRVVSRTLRSGLEKAPWLADVLGTTGKPANMDKPRPPWVNQSPSQPLRFQSSELDRVQYAQKSFTPGAVMETLKAYAPEATPSRQEPTSDPGDDFNGSQSPTPSPLAPQGDYALEESSARWSRLQVLGQAHLTYILTQSADGLIIIDQHAAHERVLYEHFIHAWEQGSFEIQNHLIPLIVELSEEQTEALMKIKEDVARLGVEIDQMGPGAVSVRSAPVQIKDSSLREVLELIADECIQRGESFALEKRIGDLCATMACHSAIRAGQALSQQEMTSLLAQMDEFPLSSFCPHGRPVFVEYPFARLERDFGRVL